MAHWRSPDFLLIVFGALLVVCLAGVVFAQHRYTAAQEVYNDHLQNLVFTPHNNVRAELNAELQTVNEWLRIRTAASIVASVAIIGVLWQVVRRRNQRVVGARTDDQTTDS